MAAKAKAGPSTGGGGNGGNVLQQFNDLTLDDCMGEVEDLILFSDLDEDDLLQIDEFIAVKKDKSADIFEQSEDEKDGSESELEDLVSDEKLFSEQELLAGKGTSVSNGKVASTEVKEPDLKVIPRAPSPITMEGLESQSLTRKLKWKAEDSFYSANDAYHDTDEYVEAVLQELEELYVRERCRVVRPDGFVSTPLHALKDLATKYNEPLSKDLVIFPHASSKKGIFHAEIAVGLLRGVGEGFSCQKATQMAALDMMLQVGRSGTFKKVVAYAIFPGWRINGRVLHDLADLCKRHKLKQPKYEKKTNVDNPEMPLYTVKCTMGGRMVASGDCEDIFTAQKLAAANAIKVITGVQYPLEYLAFGDACTSPEVLDKLGYVRRDQKLEQQRWEKTLAAGAKRRLDEEDEFVDVEPKKKRTIDESLLRNLKVTFRTSPTKSKARDERRVHVG